MPTPQDVTSNWSAPYRDGNKVVLYWDGKEDVSLQAALDEINRLFPDEVKTASTVFLGFGGRVKFDPPKAEVEEAEKALLRELKRKYPNV